MHTLLQGGVFIIEIEALLLAVRSAGIARQDVYKFLRDQPWQFPLDGRAKSNQLHRIFGEKRTSKEDPDKVKCSCSEALGVYTLLRFFFESAVGGSADHSKPLESFRAVCRVLDSGGLICSVLRSKRLCCSL